MHIEIFLAYLATICQSSKNLINLSIFNDLLDLTIAAKQSFCIIRLLNIVFLILLNTKIEAAVLHFLSSYIQ